MSENTLEMKTGEIAPTDFPAMDNVSDNKKLAVSIYTLEIACKSHLIEGVSYFAEIIESLKTCKTGNKILSHLIDCVYNKRTKNLNKLKIRQEVAEAIKIFLAKGLVIAWADESVKPFHYALKHARCKYLIHALLSSFTGVHILEDGDTVLHILIKEEHKSDLKLGDDFIEIARQLLIKGVNVDAMDSQQKTALRLAVEGSFIDVAELLLRNGASLHSNDLDQDLLHVTIRHILPSNLVLGLKFIDLLVLFGCDLNKISQNELRYAKLSPLHLAAWNGQTSAVRKLIDYGAMLKYPEIEQQPIHLAAESGEPDTVKVLLDSGAFVNEKDASGKTPLHYAMHFNGLIVIETLLKYGANVNLQDENGRTPLFEAFTIPSYPCIELLIKRGTDFNARDRDGRTAISYFDNDDVFTPWLRTFFLKMDMARVKFSDDYRILLPRGAYTDFLKFFCHELNFLSTKYVANIRESLLDLMRMDSDKLYPYTNNEELKTYILSSDFEKQYMVYAEILQAKFHQVISIRNTLEPAKEVFRQKISDCLPEYILEKILLHLNSNELTNFIERNKGLNNDNNTES